MQLREETSKGRRPKGKTIILQFYDRPSRRSPPLSSCKVLWTPHIQNIPSLPLIIRWLFPTPFQLFFSLPFSFFWTSRATFIEQRRKLVFRWIGFVLWSLTILTVNGLRRDPVKLMTKPKMLVYINWAQNCTQQICIILISFFFFS